MSYSQGQPAAFKKVSHHCALYTRSDRVITALVGNRDKLGFGGRLLVELTAKASDISRGGLYLTVKFPIAQDARFKTFDLGKCRVETRNVSLRFSPGSFKMAIKQVSKDELGTDEMNAAFDKAGGNRTKVRIALVLGQDGKPKERPQVIGWPWPYQGADAALNAMFHLNSPLDCVTGFILSHFCMDEVNYTMLVKSKVDAFRAIWLAEGKGAVHRLESRVFEFPKFHFEWDQTHFDALDDEARQWGRGALTLRAMRTN
jgi:hypothetical protein